MSCITVLPSNVVALFRSEISTEHQTKLLAFFRPCSERKQRSLRHCPICCQQPRSENVNRSRSLVSSFLFTTSSTRRCYSTEFHDGETRSVRLNENRTDPEGLLSSSQFYEDDCFWTKPTYVNRIIQVLYQLNDVQFNLLSNGQYQLDVCWPSTESVTHSSVRRDCQTGLVCFL